MSLWAIFNKNMGFNLFKTLFKEKKPEYLKPGPKVYELYIRGNDNILGYSLSIYDSINSKNPVYTLNNRESLEDLAEYLVNQKVYFSPKDIFKTIVKEYEKNKFFYDKVSIIELVDFSREFRSFSENIKGNLFCEQSYGREDIFKEEVLTPICEQNYTSKQFLDYLKNI
jgi:hypothetical protein